MNKHDFFSPISFVRDYVVAVANNLSVFDFFSLSFASYIRIVFVFSSFRIKKEKEKKNNTQQ